MTKDKLNTFAKKYYEIHKESGALSAIDKMVADGLTEAEANEVSEYMVDSIAKASGGDRPEEKENETVLPSRKNKVIKKGVATGQDMEWYDEFLVRIEKESVFYPAKNEDVPMITGWKLVDKLHPKKMEPGAVKLLNSYAPGAEPHHFIKMLVKKDTVQVGHTIKYLTFAKEHYTKAQRQRDMNLILASLPKIE